VISDCDDWGVRKGIGKEGVEEGEGKVFSVGFFISIR
jgi:hypothetical protein